jgi:hypothetical protein
MLRTIMDACRGCEKFNINGNGPHPIACSRPSSEKCDSDGTILMRHLAVHGRKIYKNRMKLAHARSMTAVSHGAWPVSR